MNTLFSTEINISFSHTLSVIVKKAEDQVAFITKSASKFASFVVMVPAELRTLAATNFTSLLKHCFFWTILPPLPLSFACISPKSTLPARMVFIARGDFNKAIFETSASHSFGVHASQKMFADGAFAARDNSAITKPLIVARLAKASTLNFTRATINTLHKLIMGNAKDLING